MEETMIDSVILNLLRILRWWNGLQAHAGVILIGDGGMARCLWR